eukprot:TRINITY_DN3126_c0_g1_i8.p1 TRINITY_DN3126_c0_g1~~TRINITY_DN3126_c0_g1_i8.p1  ORF type:complete len:259 (+),score=30.81 TRINITY_DN3126_c0_g1_i8:798-1574(+)
MASLTKMMTCLVTINVSKRLSLDMSKYCIRVSSLAASMDGTSANLKKGDFISLWDLLHGLMLPSGNDAAWTLAEGLGNLLQVEERKNLRYPELFEVNPEESVHYFVHEMNRTAKELKMRDTSYTNPHGLSDFRNRSTAADLAKLGSAAMKDPTFRQIVGTKEYTCSIFNDSTGSRESTWKNTHKLLEKAGFDGIKTGITKNAGPCLATSYRHEDVHLVIIVLRVASLEERWEETQALVEWFMAKTRRRQPSNGFTRIL